MSHATARARPSQSERHAAPDRRTFVITGQVPGARPDLAAKPWAEIGRRSEPRQPRLVDVDRRRPARRPRERVGHRPDRVARWAVLMGVFLVLVAVLSASAGG